MKKISYFKLILSIVIVSSLFAFYLANIDDDESPKDVFADCSFGNHKLLADPLICRWVSYFRDHCVPAKQLIAYIERQEKSPPGLVV